MVISPTFLKVYALHPRLVSPPTGVLRFPMANWLSTIWSSHQPWNVGITRKTRVFHQRSTKICCSFAVKRCTRTFRKHVAGISDLWSYSRPGNLTKVVFWSWYIYIYISIYLYIYIYQPGHTTELLALEKYKSLGMLDLNNWDWLNMPEHLASQTLTGWWGLPTPLKNDGVKVSWDNDIPNIYGQS